MDRCNPDGSCDEGFSCVDGFCMPDSQDVDRNPDAADINGSNEAQENQTLAEIASYIEPGEYHALGGDLPDGYYSYSDLVFADVSDPGDFNDSAHWHINRGQVFLYGEGTTPVFITYKSETHEWKVLSNEGPASNIHVYGATALDSVMSHYYRLAPVGDCLHLYRYLIDENYWESVETVFPGPAICSPHTNPIEWHEGLNQLIYIRSNTVYGLDHDNWISHGTTAVEGHFSSAQYNRTRDEMLFIGGSPAHVSLLDAQSAVEDLNDAPFEFGLSDSSLTYDPRTGNYLVFIAKEDGILWELDPGLDEWRIAPDTIGNGRPFDFSGSIVPAPIDSYEVILWFNKAGPIVYKHKSAFD